MSELQDMIDADASTNRGCLVLMIAVLFIGTVCTFAGMSINMYTMRREACEAGVAHYVTDPKTGKTTFEWKTTEK